MGKLPQFFCVLVVSQACAQTALTLPDAVARASKNYPAVQASLEQSAAVAAGVDVARAAYLPRADILAQVNRATRNSVFGLLLPQSVIPSISGPVLGTNDLTTVWGSAAGLLISWQPFDFGVRKANVDTARAAAKRAEAGRSVTGLQVGVAAADAFLTALAAEQRVAASRAGVERARVFHEVVAAQVRAGLRPGADEARTRADLAAAEIRLIGDEGTVAAARAAVAQWTGEPANSPLAAGPLRSAAPEPAAAPALGEHPIARAQSFTIEEAKARERAVARSYYPRFTLQGASYARGTGARVNGEAGGRLTGLAPDTRNWAIGMTVTFAAFDLPALRAQERAEAHRESAERAQYKRVVRDLEAEAAKAQAQVEAARRVAQNTPVQLDAARSAELQASARYNAGLGTVLEVAEAQRLLTQAETDDGLARLAVWRAFLGLAAAEGDLEPFLKAAGR